MTAAARKRAAAELGRLGGSANTDAQNAARATNAKRAGRPGRVCVHCNEPVVGGHVDRARDETCGAHGWRWQQRNAPAAAPLTDDEALALIKQIRATLNSVEPNRVRLAKIAAFLNSR